MQSSGNLAGGGCALPADGRHARTKPRVHPGACLQVGLAALLCRSLCGFCQYHLEDKKAFSDVITRGSMQLNLAHVFIATTPRCTRLPLGLGRGSTSDDIMHTLSYIGPINNVGEIVSVRRHQLVRSR